ncbi:PREDICTED: TRAF3-interacting JNK-activating modulator [Tinamus guttatus]|uniref:TRAF3-interacting JNK-activating modulator n=1 Tax=Tinamus guttatus TaxID=94827 RepID=UPI00052F2193|nr:PREDICTED: TRAF3-interacting JNK-activating modulator [Tinamus guttatus]
MISQPGKTPQRHGPHTSESYEEKCERRQETRENLRRRNNVTTCRRLGKRDKKEAEQQSQSPRQREFLRRRNLVTEERNKPRKPLPGAPAPPGQGIETHVPWEPSSGPDPESPAPLKPAWSQSAFADPLRQPRLRPSSLRSHAVPMGHTSGKGPCTDTQGTQTLTSSSTKLQDSSQQTDCGTAVLNKEIVQLSNYLKEALHRELLLKQKMVILQELFSTLLRASEKSWQGQLNEDKLKCKLRALENQLQACTQSYSKECVKKILIEMEDQKQTYEQKAKEALQKMLEDKLQAEEQLQNSQRSLAVTKEDCALWKGNYDVLKAEWTEMNKAHTDLRNNLHVLQSKLQRANTQNKQLQQALGNLENEHTELCIRISALQEDNQLKAERISAIEDQVLTTQTPPLTPATEKQNALLEQQEKEEESLKNEMQKRTSQLTAKENECTELRLELEALSDEYRSCLTKLRQCRDELNQCHSKQAKRQPGSWIPLLVVVVAMAMAAFLANYAP